MWGLMSRFLRYTRKYTGSSSRFFIDYVQTPASAQHSVTIKSNPHYNRKTKHIGEPNDVYIIDSIMLQTSICLIDY